MDAAELLKRVRRVEITTRKLSDRIFSGEYSSAFKGRGMAFAENREYQPGDEVRTIDWNVTARTGTPHVKVFEEERELTVFLLIDVSASTSNGTRERTLKDLATELSAVLAFSAMVRSLGILSRSNFEGRGFIHPGFVRVKQVQSCKEHKPQQYCEYLASRKAYLCDVG